ncbi:MAG: cytochrome c biogenesis protein CcsA [Verrucomicrobiota bacterium]|nr:cytochrome c biogenesis protein CcsA [Verrucomicrobiota bacterium]
MSEDKSKNSIKGKVVLWVLILLGIYFSFLPNRFATSSIIDFAKGEPDVSNDAFDLEGFSRIPVLRGGRVKPIDSVARNTLLVLRNKRTALDGNGSQVPAINWFAEVLFNPSEADRLKTFLIDHDQVLGLLGKKLSVDGKFFSYKELEPFLSEIDSSAREAGKVEQEKRDSFDQNIIDLYRSVLLYRKIKTTLSPPEPNLEPDMAKQLQVADVLFDPKKDSDLTDEYVRFRELTKELSSRPEDIRLGSAGFAKVVFFLDHYSRMNLWSEFFPIPPEADDPKKQWRTIGESLVGKEPLDSKEKQKMDPARFSSTLQDLVSMEPTALKARLLDIIENQKMDPTSLFAAQYAEAIKLRREVDPVLGLYETLKASYARNDFSTFNSTVAELRKIGTERAGEDASTLGFEKTYNGFEPFYRSSIAYVLIFMIAGISWLAATYSASLGRKGETARMLRNAAYILTAIVLLSHTFGLAGRMYIEGRPPVTNLYSSALFIGWGAVLLCFLTEKYLRLGVASAMGSLVGFGSLVIAHNLSLDSSLNPTGDTMEMMRAVLDSNFWLATHVVIITIGYSTTFLAGFLGIAYVFHKLALSLFGDSVKYGTKLMSTEKDGQRILGSMIYGITCFSLFFSLVGTVLGGIWADQSWGRFWGWDAKENGALLIVIWNAILLHARWSGIAKIRGIASIAIFGNIVTAWSWFGTNMLGVGLHSYGFMDKAFNPLMYFILSQLIFIGIAYLPSFKSKSQAEASA